MFFSRCSGDSVAGPPRERSCSQVKDTVPVPVVNLIPGKDGRVSEKVLIEAIPKLYYLGKVSVKRLYRFKPQKF
jgi:hypothetical protein